MASRLRGVLLRRPSGYYLRRVLPATSTTRDGYYLQGGPAKQLTVRQLAGCLGKLQSIGPAILPTRLHSRYLNIAKVASLAAHGRWDGPAWLHAHAVGELHWWLENLDHWNGRAIVLEPPQVTIETDASFHGWGAVIVDGKSRRVRKEARGFWTRKEARQHNNVLELMGVWMALRAFHEDVRGRVVRVCVDNLVTMAYVNKMGGRAQQLMGIARHIWRWCFARGITLTASYLPGVENVAADTLSRVKVDKTDLRLRPAWFQFLDGKWGRHSVDLFATRINRQQQRFFSLRPEPESAGVDAFNQVWADENAFAHPPICLVDRVLQKVDRERATLTLVAPLWFAQHWYPVLIDMACDFPVVLPRERTLFEPGESRRLEFDRPAPWLTGAWRISGDKEQQRVFRQKLRSSLALLGSRTLSQAMTPPGESGETIALPRGWTTGLLDRWTSSTY